MATISGSKFLGGKPGVSMQPSDTTPVSLSGRDAFLAKQNIKLPENASLLERGLIATQRVAEHVPQNVGFMIGEYLGGPLGAGVGSALGETLVQTAQNIGGQREGLDGKKIAVEGVTGALIPPAFKVAGQGLKIAGKTVAETVLKPFIEKVGKPLVEVAKAGYQGIKKVLPGISDDSAKTIKAFPLEVEQLATQKSVPINPVVDKLLQARDKVGESLKTYQTELDKEFAKNAVGGTARPASQAILQQEVGNLTRSAIRVVNESNIGIKDGALVFNRFPNPSKIVNAGEQKAIQEVFDLLGTLEKDLTPRNVNSVLERINALRKYDPQQPASVVITKIKNVIENGIKDIDTYKGVSAIRQKYAGDKEVIDAIDSLVPNEMGDAKRAAIAKLKGLSKEEILSLEKETLALIKEKTGVDLTKEISIWSAASEINPNLIPQDVGGLTRAVQKSANPLIGRVKLEIAKGNLGAGTGEALKQGLKDGSIKIGEVLDLFKETLQPGAKVAAFDLISSLLNGDSE